jgi:hypothetical protein
MNNFALRLVLITLLVAGLSFGLWGMIHAQTHAELPQAEVSACGSIITDTTWTSDNLFLAQDCNVIVESGATLTIQPGTSVKFSGPTAALIVRGSLAAAGSPSLPITISSINDDAHGLVASASNGSPAAQDWYGLYFAPGSTVQISQAFIGYGTAYAFNDVVGWNQAQIFVDGAALNFTDVEVAHGIKPAIYLKGDSLTPQISGTYIHDHLSGDSYHPAAAIYQYSLNMQPTYQGLTLSANDRDEVMINVDAAMSQSVTLGGTNFGFICGYTLCVMSVPDQLTMTVDPGTLLDFGSSYGIIVASGGALIAEGTPSQPITFTSRLAASGDANQYWTGLWAQPGSQLRLDNCDISYADTTNYGSGGLEINSSDVQVSNCAIHDNKREGLYLYSRDGNDLNFTLANVSVYHNGQDGVYLTTSYGSTLSFTWDGGSIDHNGWAGMEVYTWFSSIYPTLKNLSINNNGALGDADYRKRGLNFDYHSVNPVLENLNLDDNAGEAIFWYCDGSIAAHDLSASGNGLDEIQIPGCALGGGRQWDLGEANLPVRVTGDITVSPAGLLSVMPGTTLRFDKNAYGSPTGMYVGDSSGGGASLYVYGTPDQPVSFTGTDETPGWWYGLSVRHDSQLVMLNCEVAYAGNSSYANLYASWGGFSETFVPNVLVQNCEFHHSAGRGVLFDFANVTPAQPPIFHDNSLHDNALEGVANWNAPLLDATNNWWGDASGPYHPVQNPGGLGDDVGDNILFDPWLTAPPEAGAASAGMFVSTGAPTRVSPGQVVDYSVQYLNLLGDTLTNSVLIVQLPRAAEYLDSTSGIYWPERHQVFWKLGDLAPGAQDFLAFSIRFQWGLPRDYQDGTLTIFSADNYNAGEVNTQGYLDYSPSGVDDVSLLTTQEFQDELDASLALESAYNAAVAGGYTFHSAAYVTRSEGEVVLEAVMVDSALRATEILSQQGGQVLVYEINAAEVIVSDAGGGMRLDLNTGEKSAWGTWESQTGLEGVSNAAGADAGCNSDACKRNCRWSILGWEYIKGKAGRVVAWTALAPFTGGGSVAGAVWEVGSTIKKFYDCDLDCRANPNQYCCEKGMVRWSGSTFTLFLGNSCYKEKCNETTGMWVPDGFKTCVAYGERCVAGIGGPGCVACSESTTLQVEAHPVTIQPYDAVAGCAAATASGTPRCRDLELFLAKDPNALYGPVGDMLPGQTATYTVTFENEGSGRAYGVYVIDTLPDVFDETTLDLQGVGQFLPGTREIFWLVGELGPKGDPDSQGVLTYTVGLKTGLPSGTVVSNQAVVYFPSVPEETPTNAWVNQVAPLAAEPQQVQTTYLAPINITLNGREASGLPLTYEIVAYPRGGQLNGSAPDLVYTPLENFSGDDGFLFTVSNGITTSRPANVAVQVLPDGDTTPPAVLWASPADGTQEVPVSTTPLLTDETGPIYEPALVVGVSEALVESTVTTDTVYLQPSGGTPVPAWVGFDPNLDQVILQPRQPLRPETTYTLSLAAGIQDLAGNPLVPYALTFTTGAASAQAVFLPLIQR